MRRALVAIPRPWRLQSWRSSCVLAKRQRLGECVLDTLVGMAEQLCWLLCPGSENVRIAYRHQLLKVSQEQLRMATVTERVADGVIHQELRAVGENSAADGQVLPKHLDISRDPLPPLVDESTQTSPEEKADRRDRFENRSSGSGAQTSPVQPRNTDLLGNWEEDRLRRRGVHGPTGESQERELLKRKPHHLSRKNEFPPLI